MTSGNPAAQVHKLQTRRSTFREGGAGGEARKKYAEEEKELQGDIEGKSPFRCSYGPRFHGAPENAKELVKSFRYEDKKDIGGCKSCITQIKEKERFEIKKKNDEKYFQGRDDMPFHMLIHELISKPKENPKEKMLSGCEVFFPDTLFFEKGEPKFIAWNDKDFCLAKWNENEDRKYMPHAGDLIPKLEKRIKERKSKKQRHWL